MSTLQSVVDAEQWNGGPQKEPPLIENKNPDIMSNEEHGMDQATKIQKIVECQTISVGVKSRSEEFR